MREPNEVRRSCSEIARRGSTTSSAARAWIALALATLAGPLLVSSAKAAVSDSLAATTAVPWNPPRPMPPREAWEQVVLFPGRVASLPLVAVGDGLRSFTGWLERKELIPTGPSAPRVRRARLVSLQTPKLGDRAGVGGAVTLRSPSVMGLLPLVAVRYTGTVLRYNSTWLSVAHGPLAAQYEYDWRPADPLYGVGLGSSHDSLADFALQEESARLSWTWSSADSSTLAPRMIVQAWGGPRSRVTKNGRNDTETSYEVPFPALAAGTLGRRVEHLTYGIALTGDLREGRPHWSRGGRLRLAAERFDDPLRALAIHTAQAGGATFERYTLEGETGFSFLRDPRTLRLYARVMDDRIEDHPERFLFSDMARLGGRDGLAGYSPGRFRDLDGLLTRVTYVFPLARLFEFEAHSEWGAVYPDVWHDAGLRTLKNSVGFSVRGRSDRAVRAAAGLDFSRESVRIHYALGAVE